MNINIHINWFNTNIILDIMKCTQVVALVNYTGGNWHIVTLVVTLIEVLVYNLL